MKLPAISPVPSRTLAVAERFQDSGDSPLRALPPAPRYPPRPVDKLVEALYLGQGTDISLMEWVIFLREKPQWDARYPGKANDSAYRVWLLALTHPPLWEMLLWRWGLQLLGQGELLPDSIARNAKTISGRVTRDFQGRWKLLEGMQRGGARGLATMSMLNGRSPEALLGGEGLPTWGSGLESALRLCPEVFTEHRSKQTGWLIRCLEEMTLEPQLEAIEHLLKTISSQVASATHVPLIEWLGHWYGPTTGPARWSRLSPEAKRTLRDWTGAVHYRDFEQLVKMMCRSSHTQTLGLDQHNNEYKLRSRVDFWKRYRSQFLRLRILLPKTTFRLLKVDFSMLHTEDIAQLEPDPSPDRDLTEVCIFEFEAWIIAQEFRGPGSGIRLYKKTPDNTRVLLQEPLSLMKLRAHSYDAVHDHVGIGSWEGRGERLLKARDIQPEAGLKALSVKAGRDEADYLKNWNRARERREQEARSWLNGQRPDRGTARPSRKSARKTILRKKSS